MAKLNANRLEAAVAELDAAKAQLAKLLEGETAAASSSGKFFEWLGERERLTIEIGRLDRFVEALRASATEEAAERKRAALRKRRDAQVRANEVLSKRIRVEGAKAAATLLALIADVAAAEAEDAAINRLLDDNDERITSADMLARGHRLPREDISSKEIQLWCFASNGTLIGDQSGVERREGGRGLIRTSGRVASEPRRCVLRRFREVEYRAAEDTKFEPLLSAIRLPHFDKRGVVWDPSFTQDVAAALNRMNVADERSVMTELVPLDPHVAEVR